MARSKRKPVSLSPRSWKTYCDITRTNGGNQNFNRFWARYRIAKGLKSIEIPDTTPEFQRGVSAMLSVFLAFSAYEMLVEKSLKGKWYNTKLNDIELANLFRNNGNLMTFLRDHIPAGRLKDRFDGFSAGNTEDANNILVMAAAIRHKVAHGEMSVDTAQLKLKVNASGFDKLAKAVLAEADRIFTEHVEQLETIQTRIAG